ncbi:MAG: multidrug effflux MFS transporter [Gemmatimonadaceae bacterium]|nr:multidrug effflux MFS transporter [Gemmatimonadaceae bacterium]
MSTLPRRRLPARSPLLTLLLAGLATLSAFATDMSLPVLGDTAASFGVTVGQAALTLSTFMIGFASAPLISGPVSDHFGRRPMLLVGTAVYAVCGAFAAGSGSLGALLVWRLLMGAGAGTGFVIVVAMVRDLFSGAVARVRQSYINMAAGVAPVIAPTVGVVVAAAGGWRAIYGTLSGGAAVLTMIAWFALDESLSPSQKDASSYRAHFDRVRASYARVLRERLTVGCILMAALNFGALFAYITGSSLVLIGVLGIDKRTYGLLFACTSLGLMVGALTNARLSRRGVPHHRLITGGMTAITGSAVAMLALSMGGVLSILAVVPLAVVGFIGHGMVRPNVVQGALEPVPEVAGVASAIMSAVQMVTGAGVSALVSTYFDGTSARSMTVAQVVCAAVSVLVFSVVVLPAERRLVPR